MASASERLKALKSKGKEAAKPAKPAAKKTAKHEQDAPDKKQLGTADRAYRAKLKDIFNTEEKNRRQMLINFLVGKKEEDIQDFRYPLDNPQLESDVRRFLEDRPLFIQVFEFLAKNKYLYAFIHGKRVEQKDNLFGDSDSESESDSEHDKISEKEVSSSVLADRLHTPYLLVDLLEFISTNEEIKQKYEETYQVSIEEVIVEIYKKWEQISESFLTNYQRQFKNVSSGPSEMGPGQVVRRITEPGDLDPKKVDIHALSLKDFAKQRSFESKLVYTPYEHAKYFPRIHGLAERSLSYPWVANYDSTYVRLLPSSPTKNMDSFIDLKSDITHVDPNPPYTPRQYFKAVHEFHILVLHNGEKREQDSNVFKVTDSDGKTYHFEIIHKLKNNDYVTQDEDMARNQDKWFDAQKGKQSVSQVQPKTVTANLITQSLTEYGIE